MSSHLTVCPTYMTIDCRTQTTESPEVLLLIDSLYVVCAHGVLLLTLQVCGGP